MHFKYLPYVFTEHGIYTLMTVLKGDNVSFITDTLVDYLKDDSNLNKWLNEANNCEIVKFESGSISLDINVSPNEDTVWLTQSDLAILYNTSKQNISYHIQNIFNDK